MSVLFVAAIGADNQGKLIKIIGMPATVSDEDLGAFLEAHGLDSRCIILDGEDAEKGIGAPFVACYVWQHEPVPHLEVLYPRGG